MANQRNLLRPPILNIKQQQIIAQAERNQAILQQQQELVQENQLEQEKNQLNQNEVIFNRNNMAFNELQDAIRQILAEQFPILLQPAHNPGFDF